MTDTIIRIKNLKTTLGETHVHKHINLDVQRGEILGIVGASGSGKTTLLREMLALTKPTSGSIYVFGHDLETASPQTLLDIQKRWGVLFQSSALFSSLTVLGNVSFPLVEHTDLSKADIKKLALLKILMVGLPADASNKCPSELSGGMQKRAGLARALALDPELIFLDEPSSGLDPVTAAALDELILNLQRTMGLTIVMVTHDLDSLWSVANRVAFLGEGELLALDTVAKVAKNPNPLIQAFFNGPRGKVIQHGHLDGKE